MSARIPGLALGLGLAAGSTVLGTWFPLVRAGLRPQACSSRRTCTETAGWLMYRCCAACEKFSV